MTIAAEFNEELNLVDPTRAFTTQSRYSDYGENEWSVSGWTIYGGSDEACEQGASEAMYQMGYRWYTPEWTVRPLSLPSGGITLPRQEFAFPHFYLFYNYGYASWATYKEAAFNRWRALNCANDRRRPAGHAWPSLISAIEAVDGFFTANPTYMTGTIGHAGASFNLDITGTDYDALVDRVAIEVLNRLIDGRTNFDPQDGAIWSSDQVVAFANAVVAKVQETVPDAELGIYAYASHRDAPTIDGPSIYTLVSTGFGGNYIQLVQDWGAKVKSVGLRGYGIIAAQDEYSPFRGGIRNDGAFENELISYTSFMASGCNALSMESTGHHIPALVGHYALFRMMRTGNVNSHELVRADLLAHLPEFTDATKALYYFWGASSANAFTHAKTYALIDALPDNALSTQIRRYRTWYRYVMLKVNPLRSGRSGTYFSRLERALRFGKALQDDGILHGYAYGRQEANTHIQPDRPDLHTGANPHWVQHGEYPTQTLYDTLKLEEQSSLQRPAFLDDTTLALCEVTPLIAPPQVPATSFETSDGNPDYVFVGPGDVTTQSGTVTYGPGLHRFNATGLVSFNGGLLFVSSFPDIKIDDGDHLGDQWLYIPKAVRGRAYLSCDIRLTLRDANQSFDIGPHIPPFGIKDDPRQLQIGQCRFSWGGVRGTVQNLNCNPWISPQYDRALMPMALATREGLTILAEY